jgi:hypothetical protein
MILTKTPFETDHNFQKRKWFVKNYLKTNPKNEELEAIKLSEIWINMTDLKCRYPPALEKRVYQFLKNVKNNYTLGDLKRLFL